MSLVTFTELIFDKSGINIKDDILFIQEYNKGGMNRKQASKFIFEYL